MVDRKGNERSKGGSEAKSAGARNRSGKSEDKVALPKPSAAVDRLANRRAEGATARARIIERLALMSVAELRKVPLSVFDRLGSHGFAELVARSKAIGIPARGAEAKPETIPEPSRPIRIGLATRIASALSSLERRRPLPWQAVKRLVVGILAGVVFVTLVPLLGRFVNAPSISDGRPLCRQLDRFTGDCVYVVGSGSLTLTDASARLSQPIQALATLNPKLPLDRSLPRGARLVVPARPSINLR